jgi:RNA polymerase sigma-70 factor (ECF subfamily)
MIKVTTKQVEEWIDKYSPFLLNRAYFLLSNKEDAEDVVQEVFLSVCQSNSGYSGKSSVKTWLTAILHHKVADFYKKKYKSQSVSFTSIFDLHGEWRGEGDVTVWNNEEDLVDNEEFSTILQSCISKLPTLWKVIVCDVYFERRKAVEICTEKNLTDSNYWKILQRSRLQLKDCLQINWFNS